MEDGGIEVRMSWIFPQVSTTANPPPVKQLASNTSPPLLGYCWMEPRNHSRSQ